MSFWNGFEKQAVSLKKYMDAVKNSKGVRGLNSPLAKSIRVSDYWFKKSLQDMKTRGVLNLSGKKEPPMLSKNQKIRSKAMKILDRAGGLDHRKPPRGDR